MEPYKPDSEKYKSSMTGSGREIESHVISREEMATVNNPGDQLMAIALNLKAGMDHLRYTLDNLKTEIKDEVLLTLTNQFSNHIDHLLKVICSEMNRLQYLTTRYSSNNWPIPTHGGLSTPSQSVSKSTLTVIGRATSSSSLAIASSSSSAAAATTTTIAKDNQAKRSLINETIMESSMEDETVQIPAVDGEDDDDDEDDDDEDEFLSKRNEISELRIFREPSQQSTSTNLFNRSNQRNTRRYR